MPAISATHAPSWGSPSMLYAETSRRGRRVRPPACRGRGGIRGRSSDKNQGTRVTHRRAGHGVQAHRVSTSPLARRERTRTRRPRPRRSTLREREPGRMTRRTRPTHRRIKDLHPPVTISLAQLEVAVRQHLRWWTITSSHALPTIWTTGPNSRFRCPLRSNTASSPAVTSAPAAWILASVRPSLHRPTVGVVRDDVGSPSLIPAVLLPKRRAQPYTTDTTMDENVPPTAVIP
jgi:hypothetical protein